MNIITLCRCLLPSRGAAGEWMATEASRQSSTNGRGAARDSGFCLQNRNTDIAHKSQFECHANMPLPMSMPIPLILSPDCREKFYSRGNGAPVKWKWATGCGRWKRMRMWGIPKQESRCCAVHVEEAIRAAVVWGAQ